MNNEEYKKQVVLLNKWSIAYYVNDDPVATDEEYDIEYHKLLEYEDKNQLLISDDSPTKRVGGVILKGFSKAKHIDRMWSMEDVFVPEEVNVWLDRIVKNVGKCKYFCEPKFDGASMNILYEDGKLIRAITRGDGTCGEDVTENVKTIRSVPITIPYTKRIEIRGEIVIHKDHFDIINIERTASGKQSFASPRNAAAGSL